MICGCITDALTRKEGREKDGKDGGTGGKDERKRRKREAGGRAGRFTASGRASGKRGAARRRNWKVSAETHLD